MLEDAISFRPHHLYYACNNRATKPAVLLTLSLTTVVTKKNISNSKKTHPKDAKPCHFLNQLGKNIMWSGEQNEVKLDIYHFINPFSRSCYAWRSSTHSPDPVYAWRSSTHSPDPVMPGDHQPIRQVMFMPGDHQPIRQIMFMPGDHQLIHQIMFMPGDHQLIHQIMIMPGDHQPMCSSLSSLNAKISRSEQHSRRCNMWFLGVPEQDGEGSQRNCSSTCLTLAVHRLRTPTTQAKRCKDSHDTSPLGFTAGYRGWKFCARREQNWARQRSGLLTTSPRTTYKKRTMFAHLWTIFTSDNNSHISEMVGYTQMARR